MNNLTIIGNLTRDPQLREVNVAGVPTKVCNFSVAANAGYGDKQRTTFVRISCWRGQAEAAATYLRKGSKVYAAGEASVNVYIGEDKQTHAALEMRCDVLEFLTPKSATQTATPVPAPAAPTPQEAPVLAAQPMPVSDDGLPF